MKSFRDSFRACGRIKPLQLNCPRLKPLLHPQRPQGSRLASNHPAALPLPNTRAVFAFPAARKPCRGHQP